CVSPLTLTFSVEPHTRTQERLERRPIPRPAMPHLRATHVIRWSLAPIFGFSGTQALSSPRSPAAMLSDTPDTKTGTSFCAFDSIRRKNRSHPGHSHTDLLMEMVEKSSPTLRSILQEAAHGWD